MPEGDGEGVALPCTLSNDVFHVIYPPHPPREQTGTSENITFPKLRLQRL